MQQNEQREEAYPFTKIEKKWQKKWQKNRTFSVPNPKDKNFEPKKEKCYVLDMFPYPSGSGLHVGHPEGYTASDIFTRFRRRQGYNVLHPMGWDAFGLPAEQFAIETGQHPRITTEKNVENFRLQLKRIGFAYDWQREINTTEPEYFGWTQWIFLQFYNSYFDKEKNKAMPVAELKKKGYSKQQIDKKRLAFVSEQSVNWCPALGTVLANEEVIDGKSERGAHPVERRMMRQWMLRITQYAHRLLDDLDELDWPEGIKNLQRNWIGKSQGAEVDFIVDGFSDKLLKVFTTRPDTLFGATYMVLAPEHPYVKDITTKEYKTKVKKYLAKVAKKTDLERTDLAKEKSGVFSGSYAINPLNNEKIPIWIADYVLISYGSGAIMAVPGHDERDFEFATKYNLPIRKVVEENNGETTLPFVGEGKAVNSDFINALSTQKAKETITIYLEKQKIGKKAVNFKLRDWLFSRQRYWGEPFPIIWLGEKHFALDEKELPLMLPELENFRPDTGSKEINPPLAKAKKWLKYSEKFTRECNTMPQWAGSCWYYLRFCDPKNSQRFIGKNAENYWAGADNDKPGMVDLYIGGTEHAVLHLLYARFWHKVLFDLGHLCKPEPFQKLVNQGMILGEDGNKMSKSLGNSVSSDEVIEQFGADSLRLFEMFMGPLEQVKPWSTKGIQGVYRFLARVWRTCMQKAQDGTWQISKKLKNVPINDSLKILLHKTIKKVSQDCENLRFNTAISQLMVINNELTCLQEIPIKAIHIMLSLLEPFAPHLSEELNEKIQNEFAEFPLGQLSEQDWLNFDKNLLIEKEIEYIVQINGKVRARFSCPNQSDDEELKNLALSCSNVQKFIDKKEIKKIIIVSKKLINIVV